MRAPARRPPAHPDARGRAAAQSAAGGVAQAARGGDVPREDWQEAGFGIYLHWPFCAAKCPYCDFNSHVSDRIDQHRWARAYCAEIDRLGTLLPGRVVQTVFLGGGTPSLMDPELVAQVLGRIRATWPMANDPEVTLEANPTSAEAGRFAAYAQCGVTRLSLGVQALNDDDLRRLGRLHSVAEARTAYDMARAVFDRVSFDLIHARQYQTLAQWRAELTEALAMAVDHLSLYQLTIEDGTAFGARHARGGLRGLPDDDLGADMYALTQDLCDAAGLAAYEVSNHARPGAESRHNLIYWRSGDWAGIGPGAHGRLSIGGQRLATSTPLAPGAWLAAVERQGSGALPDEPLPAEEQATEYLMMSLRLAEGCDLARHARLAGAPLDHARIAPLAEAGLVQQHADRLRCTPQGRVVLNGVLRALLG
ncbi:coproporphyrinogen III oxidase [Rhodobacteraceae bacterium 2376]|uniref:Heme chaperone HemW n=1 Tax=Rhabdonatronobacter sediminivivens TaxID=2743469 RepID=A0A7Z0HZM4_9RHOB|nr:radical SAM family heme chaperone HemW [Rhabdonatronobacter sediminivivens]NYS25212.1 coproporphyrinogen III oxidase [Rhabdonatronobacter sediminivivens]